MEKKRKFVFTKLIGLLMLYVSIMGFYKLINAEREASLVWQATYMLFIFSGGIFNILDKGGWKCCAFACSSYIIATILSAAIGILFKDGIDWDTRLMFLAVIASAIRWISVDKSLFPDQEYSKDDIYMEVDSAIDECEILLKNYPIPVESKAGAKKNKNIDLERYAKEILEDVNRNANEVNKSVTVFDFIYSYGKVIEGLEELVRLNEEEGISMTPTPRKDLKTIQGGIELTIDKFIERSIANAQKAGEGEVEFLLDYMTENEIFWNLATEKNKDRINRKIYEIQQKRIRAKEQEDREQNRKKSILGKIGLEPNIDCSDIDAMEVIKQMEYRIEFIYKHFKKSAFSPKDGENMFLSFKNSCETSKLPLAAEIRLESLLNEYESKFKIPNPFYFVDRMSGHKFEEWCADLLRRNGFKNVELTPASGDQGVDVLAEKDGIRYAFQCKCYSSDLGNTPVQEVHAGKYIYHCHVGVVITNRHFTQGAKDAAQATGVLLWDREKLQSMIEAIA